jgi:hypothetical protein
MIEQIERHVPHPTPMLRLVNPPRIGQTVPAQQPRQIGAAVGVERHKLAVHQRPGWEAAENVQLRIAPRVVGQLPAP